MANSGRNTNQAQFYITTVDESILFDNQANVAYLDKKLVAFGTVLEGMDVVYRIDMCGTTKGVPKWYYFMNLMNFSKVVIIDSGEIKKKPISDQTAIQSFVPLSLRS